jgi:hypothetical protein
MTSISVLALSGDGSDFITPLLAVMKRNPIFSLVLICVGAWGYYLLKKGQNN